MKRIWFAVNPIFYIVFFTTAAFAAGCAWRTDRLENHQSDTRIFQDFAAVIVQPEDTLYSLASKYLKDPSKYWLIAEFNNIAAIYPDQKLIIPLKPYDKGRLSLKGYQTVPVLAYNNFSYNETNNITITRSVFEEQMKFLKDNGYQVITINQLFDFLNFADQIPERSVVITIDNGWRSVHRIAFPILKRYGYPFTLFVYTDLIGRVKSALSWDMIRELAENGTDIECNTKTFRDLSVIKEEESFKEYFDAINREFSECARIIKQEVGRDVKYLAYPYGETNHLITALLKKHGYKGAFTVKRGSNPFFVNNYHINRSMIYGDFDLKRFEKNLTVFKDELLTNEQ